MEVVIRWDQMPEQYRRKEYVSGVGHHGFPKNVARVVASAGSFSASSKLSA